MTTSRQVSGLKILFGKDYNKWNWKHEQLSYTTPLYISEKITDVVNRYYRTLLKVDHLDIWDMFAGLGVDLINLAKMGNYVYGNELSAEIYEILNKNIKEFNLENLTNIYNFDCSLQLKLFPIKCNVVYFDPPWGGSFNSGAKIFDFNEVKLANGIRVIDLLREIHNKITKYIVIKAPLRCNTFENLNFLTIGRIFIFRKHRLKFLFTN